MEPGIHQMTAAQYHADPAPMPSLSNSILKVLLTKSPAHARLLHPVLNPDYRPTEADRFDIGTAAHSILLESEDRCCIVEADDWRTKDAKMQRDMARATGLTPLLRHQYDEVQAMVGAARAYIGRTGVLAAAFAAGKPEQALFWQEGSIWCRGLLDWITDDRSVIVDVKTTSAESPAAFMRSMAAFGYDTQQAFYTRGVHAVTGIAPEFYFLVIEDTAPHACYMVQCAASLYDLGGSKVSRGIKLWTACMEQDLWPSYSPEPYEAEAPAYAIVDEEMRL